MFNQLINIPFGTSSDSLDVRVKYNYDHLYLSKVESAKNITVSITPHITSGYSTSLRLLWKSIAFEGTNYAYTNAERKIVDYEKTYSSVTNGHTYTIDFDLSDYEFENDKEYLVLGIRGLEVRTSGTASLREALGYFAIGTENSNASYTIPSFMGSGTKSVGKCSLAPTTPEAPTIQVTSSGEQLGVEIEYIANYTFISDAINKHLTVKNGSVVVADMEFTTATGTYTGNVTVDPHVNTSLTFILSDEFNTISIDKVVKRKQVVWDCYDDGEHVAFYVGAEVPDFINQNLFKVNMDSEFVGNVKAPNLLKVVEQQLFDNKTISGSGNDNGYVNVNVESGYVPVGVLGYRIFNASSSGSNATACYPTQICIMNNQVRYYVVNRGSSSAKIQMIAYVLCMYGG